MYIYVIVLIFIFILTQNKRCFSNEKLRTFMLILISLFLCTGYMTGSDWRSYELDYYNISSMLSEYQKELGLFWIFRFANAINLDFWPLWIAIKLLCFWGTIKTLSYFTDNHYEWALLYFLAYRALFYYIDNPMRNLIASAVFVFWGLRYLAEGQTRKYLISVLVACFFHLSSALMLPLVLFIKLKKSVSFKFACSSIILSYVFFVIIGSSAISSFIGEIAFRFFGEGNRLSSYINDETVQTMSIGTIFQAILFFYIVLHKDDFCDKYKDSHLMLNLAYVGIVCQGLGFAIPIFSRFSMFLFVPFAVCLSMALQNSETDINKFVRAMLVVFCIYTYTATIRIDHRYIPYSSYLEYVFKKKPSYIYRSSFNYMNSPYAKRQDR